MPRRMSSRLQAVDDTWWGTETQMFGPRNAHRVSLIFERLRDVQAGARVLEAAVGVGDVAERLRRRGCIVVGADLSLEALLIARQRTRAHLVVADLTALPFRDETFHVVSSAETIEHIPDDAQAVRELARVLVPAGQAVVTVPALEALRTFADRYYGHLRRYTRAQLTRLFEQGGFDVRSAMYWGFPFVVAYDYCVMLPLSILRSRRSVAEDPALRAVALAGRKRLLVSLVQALFRADRFFRWLPAGVGLVLTATKRKAA